ncbi:MAG: hypothetical protein ACOYMD_11245 [Paludibacter sp.]
MKTVNLFQIIAISYSLISFISCADYNESYGLDASYFTTVTSEAATTVTDQSIEIAEDCIKDFEESLSTPVKELNKVSSSLGYRVEYLTENNVYPAIALIDYGTDGFVDKYGRTIKGKVFITTSQYKASKLFKFSDFWVNGNSVKGYKLIESNFQNQLIIQLQDTILLENKTSIIHDSFRKRTSLGANSFSTDGYTKGKNTKNESFSMVIEKPLVTMDGYKYYVSGVTVTTTDKGSEVRDYGNGEKDNIVTSTIDGGFPIQVTLNW